MSCPQRPRAGAWARHAAIALLLVAASCGASLPTGSDGGQGVGGGGRGAGGAGGGSGGTVGSGGTLGGSGGALGGAAGTGPGGGSAGAVPTGGAGAIVRGAAPTEQTASTTGPYTVMRYSMGLTDSPSYAGYDVDYPADAAPPFAGVAIIPGFIEGRSAVGEWGPFLASHGFAVITIDPNVNLDVPSTRATALWAAIGSLKEENTRSGGPLAGKVDVTRFAVMGHSMGGGATLQVANAHSAELKATIPLHPWNTTSAYGMVTVPTMIMAGQNDGVAAPAQHATPFYNAIPASTAKAYVEFAGGDHYAADDPKTNATSALLGLSWLKVHVEGDGRYRAFIKSQPALSAFLTNF
jgi:pimeloyl-ACP methyl ester carboxylesterase